MATVSKAAVMRVLDAAIRATSDALTVEQLTVQLDAAQRENKRILKLLKQYPANTRAHISLLNKLNESNSKVAKLKMALKAAKRAK